MHRFLLKQSLKREKMAPKKLTYWVRSKQLNEDNNFGRMPVPARFQNFEEAKLYRRELNLRRGAYHPGYYVERQDDSPAPFVLVAKWKIVIPGA